MNSEFLVTHLRSNIFQAKAIAENTTHESCSSSLHRLVEEFEGEEEICKHHRKELVGEAALKALPILFPFIIEMTLIGASVFLVMSFHIGRY